jgi:F1F0 ATPase subunit 2
MGEISILIRALLAGLLLGILFYGGLWWTVRRSMSTGHVGIWLIGSFLLRASITIGGFYFVAQGDWRALLACLLGFLMARICVTRLTSTPPERRSRLLQGSGR